MDDQNGSTPKRFMWDVASQMTETLHWPTRTNGQPKTILFFIPGNPGIVTYYKEFLEEIYQKSARSLEIYGVSHLGHSIGAHALTSQNPDKCYSLQEQIDHKINCLDLLKEMNPSDTQFILMGHSAGAYISTEVLKERQNHGITRLIALFPTLREIALTPNGIKISRLVSVVPTFLLSGAAHVVSLIPNYIRESLLGIVTGQSGDSLNITAHELLHGIVIKNVLHMAAYEMEMIKELDYDFYNAHVNKFIIYYSKNDGWAPLDHYNHIKEKFPNEPEHTTYMAEQVSKWIEKDCISAAVQE
ncbi:hypothetical protein EC973_009405 [Apophysomyces ossiformis]|uniref:Lipid droplet-associated hydrolase n=1 Tax=Apophysomyces ossiformis TaxID=679940 RepID=A0A8H7BRJ7_9FUNG|nr:hypothetical protein EC973_009405 [Apophysomyces ossiformis]